MSLPVGFTEPAWLWLALPAAAIVVIGWLAASRTLPRARRIGSLVVRLVLVACLVLALAGMRLALPADRLSVVFLLDASASMLDASREELVEWARDTVGDKPEGDTAAVVVFGANALVDRLPSEVTDLADPASQPVVGATDIGAAVRLAAAIMPAGHQARIVLLSDGNDTAGEADAAIAAAATRGIRLDVVMPADESAAEVLVDAVDAPNGARVGETIDLSVRLRSTITTDATLRLLADGATIATRELSLEPGVTTIPFSVTADEAGFHVFRAIIEPDEDRFTENNAADAYVLVTGEPRVLLATDDATRAADLVASLTDGNLDVDVVASTGVPSSLTTLAGYDAVVLDNVEADALGEAAMESLQVYVRDLGKGLVMLGGRDSYGAGGYLDTPIEETMPVYMTVRDRERSPDVAMVAVVDQSGSMADCHCTGDSRDTANPSGQRGFEKVDIAKEAILRAAEALAPTDQLGVVTFNENAHWAVRTSPIDFGALQAGLGFRADGNTNIYAGLKAAYDDLVQNPATLRHIILITDGWSQSGAYDDLLADMRAAGITLSTIGTGGGSAHVLRELAERSGGRYYDAADATTIPDIFLRETIRQAGEQVVEEEFQPIPSSPSEILEGLDAGRLPQLRGYNATTAKGSATVSLLTGREDPLLAQWQYGLGRAAAWTSDARQAWATPWIGTPEFGTLTAQLVAWTLPPQDAEGIDVRFSPGADGRLNVEVTSIDDDGAPRNFYRTVLRLVSPDLEPTQAVLEQVGPGRYAGTIRADDPGAYLVRVAQTYEDEERTDAASRTLGLVSPAADEFRRLGVDADALARFADAGGGVSHELGVEESDTPVWRHDIPASAFPTPVWPWLLLLAIVLVPIDVGVRRVALARSDLDRARAWVARRVGLGTKSVEEVPGLSELRAARDRSVRRSGRLSRPTAGGADAVEPVAATQATPPPPVAAAMPPPTTSAPRQPAAAPAPPPPSAPAAPTPPPGAGAEVPGETLAERLARRRRGGR
ncbi:MAG TPA: VWA domain-containing protein [Candidatus Limnocylindria bacterium]|nr:VWA domain-containing protein [Candidatus Limnocylindria bacterium]